MQQGANEWPPTSRRRVQCGDRHARTVSGSTRSRSVAPGSSSISWPPPLDRVMGDNSSDGDRQCYSDGSTGRSDDASRLDHGKLRGRDCQKPRRAHKVSSPPWRWHDDGTARRSGSVAGRRRYGLTPTLSQIVGSPIAPSLTAGRPALTATAILHQRTSSENRQWAGVWASSDTTVARVSATGRRPRNHRHGTHLGDMERDRPVDDADRDVGWS